MSMKASQVRSTFLEFFAERGHQPVASSSLVPANDPTLLFTNAGMNQFKDVFTGQETRGYKRAASSQKCVRAGGKHNDLEEVGKTPRHHTFFEMLGNFSFGDYFKEDAIAWAWELLTRVYGIDQKRLVVTVYGGDKELPGVGADDEARAIWKRVTGFGDDRVIGLGKADNFWMMGDTGPMGPCSEIHFDTHATGKWPTTDPASWKGWLEIWNLVFMQFERKVKDGPLDPLPAPSIDTGAGLERTTSVVQGVKSNYDTDLFTGIIAEAASIARVKYGGDDAKDTSLRVIADHARASTFLIGDGVFPDKDGRNYVLRRIFRRAVRHGQNLGIKEPFMHQVCAKVIDEMSAQYPDLRTRASVITEVALDEEKRFRATLERGLDLLEDEFRRNPGVVSGKTVFTLYDTYGFPADLTQIIAEERGRKIDEAGYKAEMDAAKERSSFSTSDEAVSTIYKELANKYPKTEFLGYQTLQGDAKVLALVVDGKEVPRVAQGKVAVVLDRTPFYAESGGQIGDTGTVGSVRVEDTKKPAGDLFVHFGVAGGPIAVGDTVAAQVDGERRDQIRANHSATHLLNHALHTVLGAHVTQKGSLVAPDRLRFDFAHFSPMSEEQKRQVEDLVNNEVRRNDDSQVDVLPIDEARQRGAVAMFGEKYGDKVRVVRIGHESLEFCGGTHVRRAGDIGLFKILSETGVAQGVRRIEAVTGAGALAYLRRLEDELAHVPERIRTAVKPLEKEISQLKSKLASGAGGRDLLSEAVVVKGVKVLAVQIDVDDPKVLRDTGDQLRDKLGSGVVLLAGVGGPDKVTLMSMVSKDLVGRLHAGKLLGAAAEVLGGRGGGKPDLAQGGGKDAAKLPEALAAARKWVEDNA
jgi:alanyl-tRNA synthetase